MLLSKGFEIELYTGTPQGEIVGLSDRISQDLPGFVTEPDSRNVEYVTDPYLDYQSLLCALLRPRRQLRDYLKRLGDYTLIPGSTLSLGDSQVFYRSNPLNDYHGYIEQTYGTQVVTASVHINVGISDPEQLMRACRLVRLEAPLYLALSASSPFLDGKATGHHSTRWAVFPKTPAQVPLFESHGHFIRWTEEQLAAGTMQNVRHLWSSVRPNGPDRPHDLNRLELRICDLMVDPVGLLAVTALLETRIQQMLADPSLDPLSQSRFTPQELVELTDRNEQAAAHDSLRATLIHWQDGREISAQDWIEELYEQGEEKARELGIRCFLSPLLEILRSGNSAQQWLAAQTEGRSTQQVMVQAIQAMEEQEQELEDKLCQSLLA